MFRSSVPLAPYLGVWVVAHTVVLAKNAIWWGGTSFGPRYLSEASLPLTLLIGMALSEHVEKRGFRLGLLVAGCLSIAIQFVGAFFGPCEWADDPIFADSSQSRSGLA